MVDCGGEGVLDKSGAAATAGVGFEVVIVVVGGFEVVVVELGVVGVVVVGPAAAMIGASVPEAEAAKTEF